MNQIFRYILIVGQQLFGIFWQAVTSVAEARVVVMRADARIQADTLDDGLGVQSLHLCIRIQFVEVAYTQCQVGIGKQLHCLCFFQPHEQRIDVFLDGSFL